MKHFIPLILLTLFFVNPVLAQSEKYTCPMHPHYISDRPGTCPICGMDLVALEDDSSDDMSMDMPSSMEGEAKTEPANARTSVRIDPETIQSSGIRSEKAQMARFGMLVRSYGDVTENIRLQFDISSRVEGWIEELKVQAVGDTVKKGDLLFTLYSPALTSAQKDLISALETGYKGRIDAAAKRLSSLGMQDQAISEIKKKRKAFDNVPFYAEVDGLVSDINVREGTYTKPGMRLITVQNYNSVWIDVSVAEQDIPFITKDTNVSVSLPALGIRDREASIDYIYPTIDQSTRTGRVRLVLNNEDGKLKPGAYADVEFETDVEQRLSIPSDSILKSKDGDYVVLAQGNGRFQPVKILAGLTYKGRTEVLEGISENDDVVISGQFLIDSESALRESFRKMQRMQTPLALLEVSADQLAMIDHLIDAAIYMQKELYNGNTPNPNMIMPAVSLGDHLMPVFRGTKLQFVLEDAEKALQDAKNSVTDQEWQTSLNKFVNALKPWLLEGKPQHYQSKGLKLYMAHGLDTYWLQLEDEPHNPYGEGHPMKIDWPKKVDAKAPEVTEMPAGGAHANH